jgi:hypothetical protein
VWYGAAEAPKVVTLESLKETVQVIHEEGHKHTIKTCTQSSAMVGQRQ